MSRAITFDTLQYAKKLKHAGVSDVQAEAQAEALAEVIDEQIATKQDILELKLKIAELKSDIIKWVLGIVAGQSVLLMSFIALIKFLH